MLRTIMYTFFLVFIAELGDKTQLATMMIAAKSQSTTAVFIGSSIALVCSSLIGVIAGTYITKFVPANYIQISAGILFLIMGVLILSGKI